jgi:hypothetical protein
MGSYIIDRVLGQNSFFVKNRLKEITTVFPATTVAALTAFETGLNPIETGMLGWSMYYKGIDKVINVFRDVEKQDTTKTKLPEAHTFKEQNMNTPEIVDQINKKGEFKAYKLYPFGDDCYDDLQDMCNKILSLSDLPFFEVFVGTYETMPLSHLKQLQDKKFTNYPLTNRRKSAV